MYFLERKEPHALPNILGNHSFPVHTYRWKTVAVCKTEEPLQRMIPADRAADYLIISNNEEGQP